MKLTPGQIYHVYNRGNNKQQIFYEEDNYIYFINKMKKYVVPYCDVLAYSLMPNHFHFLIYANEKTSRQYRRTNRLPGRKQNPHMKMTLFSRGLQELLSSYSKGINKKFNRTGSLFQQNTKFKLTSSDSMTIDYALWCFIYIHNNPKTAGLVRSLEEYKFSSFQEYLGQSGFSICNVELARKLLSLDLNELFLENTEIIPDDILKRIF